MSAADGLLFQRDLFGVAVTPSSGVVAKRFGIPPFTVLDARSGPWTERKAAWQLLGLRGDQGRGDDNGGRFIDRDLMRGECDYFGKADGKAAGTSIFDPVLCELAYSWFCPPGGAVLDPFAGGSTRGLVATLLGYQYTGIELRVTQIAANEDQAAELLVQPAWLHGDASRLQHLLPPGAQYDMVFTCPPYYDLEAYGGGAADGSAVQRTYPQFLQWYEDMFAQCVERLRSNRMLAVVVGDIRDPQGSIRGFVPDTVRVLQGLGLHFYNEAVLLTAVGSMAIRVTRQFRGGRKLCRGHQQLLVFYKGQAANMGKRLREPPWDWPADEDEGAE